MKKGAIAFLDILGFKGIWQHRSEQEILKMLLEIPELVKKTYKAPSPDRGYPEVGEPNITVLSDTIIITFESEHAQTLLLMCTIIDAILRHLLKQSIFARGAIGWGEYTQEGTVFIGPAIDDVAMWHEAANWIGVITTPKTNYMIDRISTCTFGVNGHKVDSFIKYDVPMKSSKPIRLNVFNWPGFIQKSYKEEEGNVTQLIIQAFSLQGFIDASVHEKYEQTLKFIDHALSTPHSQANTKRTENPSPPQTA